MAYRKTRNKDANGNIISAECAAESVLLADGQTAEATITDSSRRLSDVEGKVAELEKNHTDDFCFSYYEVEQLAPEALEVKGNRAYALDWHPFLVDMTDNAGPEVNNKRVLRRNNWFRDDLGSFSPAVCITAEDWALCDQELYLDAAHTQKYCEAGAFDAVAFYNMYGVAKPLYTVDGNMISHIRRPWETVNKDLSIFVGRKDKIRLCDNQMSKSGKLIKGVFGSQNNYDGAQFGQFVLDPTGLAPSPVCTINKKTRSFFYLMNGEAGCTNNSGYAGKLFLDATRTFPRHGDMHQFNDMEWARANNANPQSPVPFAEGGYFALNAFLTCMEVGYGTKFFHAPNMFSSGISSADPCSDEQTWKSNGGVRLKKAGAVDWTYRKWSDSSDMAHNASGDVTNMSLTLNSYAPKMGVCEAQIAASYAVEMGIPAGQKFDMYGCTYRWERVDGAVGLDEGEMNCRIYKLVAGVVSAYNKDGSAQDFDVECMLRVGLIQGMDVSGDVFAYWGGGYDQVGIMDEDRGRYGYDVNVFLQPDQSKWVFNKDVHKKIEERFLSEDQYFFLGTHRTKTTNYVLSRIPYAGFPDKNGGNSRTGECYYAYVENYWGKVGYKTLMAVRSRGAAHNSFCAPRYLIASYSAQHAATSYAGSAQVRLGATRRSQDAVQAQR